MVQKKFIENGSKWIYTIYYYTKYNKKVNTRLFWVTITKAWECFKLIKEDFLDARLYVWNDRNKTEHEIKRNPTDDGWVVEMPDEEEGQQHS